MKGRARPHDRSRERGSDGNGEARQAVHAGDEDVPDAGCAGQPDPQEVLLASAPIPMQAGLFCTTWLPRAFPGTPSWNTTVQTAWPAALTARPGTALVIRETASADSPGPVDH